MTGVGRWGQWFVFTLVLFASRTASGIVHPTSPQYRHTIFLAVFHEADLLQPFPASVFTSLWSFILHYVTEHFQLLLLYQVCYDVWSFYLVSDTFVGDSIFPAHFQYSPVAAHLKCDEFPGVCCPHSPRFSSVEQAGKHAKDEHIYLSLKVQVTAVPQSLQHSQSLTRQVYFSTYFCTAIIVSCYQTSKIHKFMYTFYDTCAHCNSRRTTSLELPAVNVSVVNVQSHLCVCL